MCYHALCVCQCMCDGGWRVVTMDAVRWSLNLQTLCCISTAEYFLGHKSEGCIKC